MRFSNVVRPVATFIILAAFLLFGNSIASAYQQRSIENGNGKPTKIAIWLPDTANPSSTAIHRLVLISHGNGGGLAAHSDTAEALAAAGYIVVAIAHTDDTKGDDRDPAHKWLVDRVGHVRRVLDYMQSEWEGRATVDRSRIGAFGFSAGGFTILVASGASPSAALAQEYCRNAAPEFACRLKLDTELSRVGEAANPWPHDDRIRAAVIAAPALGFSFDRSGLARVDIPIQLWAAENDDRAPAATNIAPLLKGLPSLPEYHLVRGADHFALSRPCEPGDKNRRSCSGPAGFDRAAFHDQFNQKVVEFFNRALNIAPKQ